jgi:glycosyltransferase involved in cell wall biosynthesis
VLLTARDEEKQLPGALDSVARWASEVVVVVDPRTRDATREVARELGARVLEHPFESSAAQCNWGLDRCESGWVLVLDADERVTPPLQEEIGERLVAPGVSAYAVRRVNFAFGRRVRFGDWGRDEIVRLVDRTKARFAERSVHGAVVAPSLVGSQRRWNITRYGRSPSTCPSCTTTHCGVPPTWWPRADAPGRSGSSPTPSGGLCALSS